MPHATVDITQDGKGQRMLPNLEFRWFLGPGHLLHVRGLADTPLGKDAVRVLAAGLRLREQALDTNQALGEGSLRGSGQAPNPDPQGCILRL